MSDTHPWRNHVRQICAQKGLNWKEALPIASASWRKRNCRMKGKGKNNPHNRKFKPGIGDKRGSVRGRKVDSKKKLLQRRRNTYIDSDSMNSNPHNRQYKPGIGDKRGSVRGRKVDSRKKLLQRRRNTYIDSDSTYHKLTNSLYDFARNYLLPLVWKDHTLFPYYPQIACPSGTEPQIPSPDPSKYPTLAGHDEHMLVVYYEFMVGGRKKHILYLGETHETPSLEDIGDIPMKPDNLYMTSCDGSKIDENGACIHKSRSGLVATNETSKTNDYLDALNRVLSSEHRCLDVYAEDPYKNKPNRRTPVQATKWEKVSEQDISFENNYDFDLDAFDLDAFDMTGNGRKPQTGGHARSALYAYTNEPHYLDVNVDTHEISYNASLENAWRNRMGDSATTYKAPINRLIPGRRSHKYDQRTDYWKCVPGYNCDPSWKKHFTIDQLLALYLGIGPEASGGNPLKSVESHYMKLFNISHTDDGQACNPRVAKCVNLQDFNNLRKVFKKTFHEFQTCHPSGRNEKFVLFALRQAVFRAQRGFGDPTRYSDIGSTVVDGFAIEAFADIYGFLRMMRRFDPNKRSNVVTCGNIGFQDNVVWLSHWGHCITSMLLLATFFNAKPMFVHVSSFGGDRNYFYGEKRLVECIQEAIDIRTAVLQGGDPVIPSDGLTNADGSAFRMEYDIDPSWDDKYDQYQKIPIKNVPEKILYTGTTNNMGPASQRPVLNWMGNPPKPFFFQTASN